LKHDAQVKVEDNVKEIFDSVIGFKNFEVNLKEKFDPVNISV
jgi:hypothetical protein